MKMTSAQAGNLSTPAEWTHGLPLALCLTLSLPSFFPLFLSVPSWLARAHTHTHDMREDDRGLVNLECH